MYITSLQILSVDNSVTHSTLSVGVFCFWSDDLHTSLMSEDEISNAQWISSIDPACCFSGSSILSKFPKTPKEQLQQHKWLEVNERNTRMLSNCHITLLASLADPSSCSHSRLTSSPFAGKRVIKVDLHLNQLKHGDDYGPRTGCLHPPQAC